MHITFVYIITSPLFDIKAPILHIYSLQYDILWIDCLWVHVLCLWLFDRYSMLRSNMDFHHGSCHLWCPHHSLSYKSLQSVALVEATSCIQIIWSFIAWSSTPWHIHPIFLQWDTEFLEVCLTVWRSGRLYAKCCPHYCIVIIFHYLLTSQPHILFFKHHFRILSPSIVGMCKICSTSK